MENPNAFIGQATAPTADELASALGAAVVFWQELIAWFAEQKVVVQEWNSYSIKAGWALRLKVKKRNIITAVRQFCRWHVARYCVATRKRLLGVLPT